jgi:hypothetical protein
MTGRTVTTSGSLQLDLTRLVDAIVQGLLDAGVRIDSGVDRKTEEFDRSEMPPRGTIRYDGPDIDDDQGGRW